MRISALCLLIACCVASGQWLSPREMPKGATKIPKAQYTQSIFVLDGRDVIEKVPIGKLESKWHQSGGIEGIQGVQSDKYRTLPRGKSVKHWLERIEVKNSFGHYQPNLAIVRAYPVGTRFDDILSYKGKVFEHRMRERIAAGWRSRVIYRDSKAYPPGYTGLKQSCSSCHGEAGSGEYGVGLVPGGDGALSDPLDWSIWSGGN